MCPQPETPKPEKPTREDQLLTREQIPQSQSHFIPARYSDDERATLVRLAHESIDSALEEREIKLQAIPERLQEPRGGAFKAKGWGFESLRAYSSIPPSLASNCMASQGADDHRRRPLLLRGGGNSTGRRP